MARTILIENTTISTKTWVGQLLDAAETFDIPEHKMSRWANDSTVITDVASGDLKVIKSTGPTVYYTAAEGQRVLDGLPVGIVASGNAGELLCSSPTGDLVWTQSVGGTIVFFNDGISSNKWMKIVDASGRTSDLTPHVFLFDAVIYGISFVNHLDSRSSDIELYKNGTLLFTWSIVTKRWAYKTNGLSSLTFSAGDRLSIFMSDTGSDANDPILTLYFSFLNETQGEGGAASGV